MKHRTKEIVTELETRMGQAGKAAFERLGLALELLEDTDWVAERGSLNDAHRFIQREYFGDLCLAVRIETLLEIRREFPNIADWETNGWDVTRLRALILVSRKKDRERPTMGRQKADVVETAPAELISAFKEVEEIRGKLETETDRLNARIKELEAENITLKCENERLKGRLEELEKIRAA